MRQRASGANAKEQPAGLVHSLRAGPSAHSGIFLSRHSVNIGCSTIIFPEKAFFFDALFTASCSAGTQAGLIAGTVAFQTGIPVHGINVNRKNELQVPKVLALARETAALIGAGPVPDAACINYDGYIGQGYSIPTDGMIEAVRLLAHTEGILLDPVYSGKCMAGLIDLVRKGTFAPGANIVFLHTGGSPALYVYSDIFQ